ncbi:unnamed protein product [Ectocarpus sp. 12 AP-2014]
MDTGSYLEFLPPPEAQACGEGDTTSGKNHRTGVVIFPGALVPPSAYAPLARTMARKGYPSYILRFEFNLATKGWETTSEIISRSVPAADGEGRGASCSAVGSRPTKWVLAGHSMGTVGIEMFYAEHPESVDGVVYMGSGNMIGDAMKGSEVPAMVLRGSRDPFVPAEALARSAHKLPKDVEIVVVEGGSHRGFGSYKNQPLDWQATITEKEQRGIIVEALTDFIGRRVAN